MNKSPQQVQRGGRELPRIKTAAELSQRDEGWAFDVMKRTVWVKFPDQGRAETVVVK
jgi:hypothetical protein